MNEADLRTQVIMPLYQALGYNNVCEYHGHDEKGKDVVATEHVNSKEEYTAIVAKASNISGQAKGRGSANEAYFQVRQALAEGFSHPLTGQQVKALKCHIVTSGKIAKSARDSLSAILEDDGLLDKVTFIDGTELWSRVQANLTTRTIHNALSEARDFRDNADPDYFIHQIPFGKDGTLISPEPKDPSKPAPPATLKYSLAFDNSPEAEHQAQALQALFERGIPVKVSGKYINEVDVHKSLRVFFSDNPEHIEFHTIGQRIPGPIKIEILVGNNTVESIPYTQLWQHRNGVKEQYYSNHHTQYPLLIEITRQNNGVIEHSIQISLRSEGAPLHQVIAAVKFMKALWNESNPTICITSLDTSEEFLRITADQPTEEEQISALRNLSARLGLLEKLKFIEARTRSSIVWPKRKITNHDVKNILYWHDALTDGDFESKNDHIVTAFCDREHLKNSVTHIQTTNLCSCCIQNDDFTFKIFDQHLSAGPIEIRWDFMRVTPSSKQEIVEYLKSRRRKPLPVRLRTVPNGKIRGRFIEISNKGSLQNEVLKISDIDFSKLPEVSDELDS